MSALQHLASCHTITGRPIAIKKSRARKITPLDPPPSAGEKPGPATAAEELALIQRAVAGEPEAPDATLRNTHAHAVSRSA